ncbi:hypothetical protein FRX31_007325, partial [Thalictrum thalictroides]
PSCSSSYSLYNNNSSELIQPSESWPLQLLSLLSCLSWLQFTQWIILLVIPTDGPRGWTILLGRLAKHLTLVDDIPPEQHALVPSFMGGGGKRIHPLPFSDPGLPDMHRFGTDAPQITELSVLDHLLRLLRYLKITELSVVDHLLDNYSLVRRERGEASVVNHL